MSDKNQNPNGDIFIPQLSLFWKKGATPHLNCISSKWNSFPCNSKNRMNEKKHNVNSEIIDCLNQKKIAREEYGSSVLFVCRSRRLNGTVLRWDRKNRGPVRLLHVPRDKDRLPSYSMAASAEQRPQICSPSWVILTPLFHWFFCFRAWR